MCLGTPHAPPEVSQLRFTNKSSLSWDSVPVENPAALYSVVRGVIGEFPPGSGPSDVCLIYYLAPATFADAAEPPPGSGFWYLTRSWNFCAFGSWGSASDGTPRAPSVCS
jgi:hypothetical protein